MPSHIGALCRRRKEKSIGTLRTAAGIEGHGPPLRRTLPDTGPIEQVVLISHADIVEIGDILGEIVESALYLEVRVCLAQELMGWRQNIHWALVHRDAGAVKPALLLEVCRKVLEEREQEGFIVSCARFQMAAEGAVGPGVVVVETEMPRQDGIAVYLALDAV